MNVNINVSMWEGVMEITGEGPLRERDGERD